MILYFGGKYLIANALLDVIPPATHFYDLFGGGGSVTETALEYGRDTIFGKKWEFIHYNDKQTGLYLLNKDIWNGAFDFIKAQETWVSFDDFHRLRNEPTAWGAWVRYAWSYQSAGMGYAYKKTSQPRRKAYLQLICDQHRLIHGRKRITKEVNCLYGKREIVLIHIRRLQHIRDFTPNPRLHMTNLDYRQVEIPPDSVVYCDIPYLTKESGINGYYTGDFDRQAFLDWASSRDFPVYISEYAIDDARFIEVFKVRKMKDTAHNGKGQRGHIWVWERLYWNGKNIQKE